MIATPERHTAVTEEHTPRRRSTPVVAIQQVARSSGRGLRGIGSFLRSAVQRVLSEGWNVFTFYIALVLGKAVQTAVQDGLGTLLLAPHLIDMFYLKPIFPVLSPHPVVAIPIIAGVFFLGAACHRANTLEFRRKLDRAFLRVTQHIPVQEDGADA